MINITTIYLIEGINNSPNKVYIGKTKSPKMREHSHKKTYGSDIVFNVIDEINSLRRQDWEPLETYWIEQFKAWGFNVVNKRKKGGSGPEYQTTKAKQKISNANKGNQSFLGHNHSELTKRNMSMSAKGKSKSKEHRYNMSKASKGKSKPFLFKPIMQYDKQGLLINIWDNITDASTSLNILRTCIISCCKNRSKSSGGFIWKYKLN
jgi:group I intron endonuclease